MESVVQNMLQMPLGDTMECSKVSFTNGLCCSDLASYTTKQALQHRMYSGGGEPVSVSSVIYAGRKLYGAFIVWWTGICYHHLWEVRKMDNRKVGELIRRLRKESHMTQLQLAEKLHVSDKAVSKWERGGSLS